MRSVFTAMAMISALVLTAACGKVEQEIVVPRQTIQATLDKKFPIERNAMVARLKLESPKVYFKGDRVGVTLDCNANILVKSLKGTVDFNGLPVYRPMEAAFYLDNVIVEKISANEADLAKNETIKNLAENLIFEHTANNPVHVLGDDSAKDKLARLLIKSIGVRGDSLVVVLSPGDE